MLARVRDLRIPHPAHPPAALLCVGLLGLAVSASASLGRLDAWLGALARAAASELSRDVGFVVSTLGGTDLVMPLTAASALLLCGLRHWRGALTLVTAVLATQAVVHAIKLLVERPRPTANGAVAEAGGFSFPSAHSATAMALYATLTLLAAGALRGRARALVACAGAALIGAIGLSRVFLAAHYPIDVLAGWLTGAALVGGSWLLFRRLSVAPAPRPGPA